MKPTLRGAVPAKTAEAKRANGQGVAKNLNYPATGVRIRMTLDMNRIRELLNLWYPLGGTFQPLERPEIPWTPALEDLVAQLATQNADGPTIASAISMYRPILESHEMVDAALCVHELIATTPDRDSAAWNQILRPTPEEWSVQEQKRLDYFNKTLEDALAECQAYAAEFAALSPEGMTAYVVETPHPERWAALTKHITKEQRTFLDAKLQEAGP